MLTSFLFPILVMTSSALVQVIFFRVGPNPQDENPEFRFSKAIRIFCWIGILLISLVPVAFSLSGTMLSMSDWLFFGVISILGIACCVYAEKFTLKFWDDHLTIGAFKRSDVSYKEITSAMFVAGGGGTTSLLIKTPKKKIAVSGYLGSIDHVEKVLKKKLSALPKT